MSTMLPSCSTDAVSPKRGTREPTPEEISRDLIKAMAMDIGKSLVAAIIPDVTCAVRPRYGHKRQAGMALPIMALALFALTVVVVTGLRDKHHVAIFPSAGAWRYVSTSVSAAMPLTKLINVIHVTESGKDMLAAGDQRSFIGSDKASAEVMKEKLGGRNEEGARSLSPAFTWILRLARERVGVPAHVVVQNNIGDLRRSAAPVFDADREIDVISYPQFARMRHLDVGPLHSFNRAILPKAEIDQAASDDKQKHGGNREHHSKRRDDDIADLFARRLVQPLAIFALGLLIAVGGIPLQIRGYEKFASGLRVRGFGYWVLGLLLISVGVLGIPVVMLLWIFGIV